MLVITDKEQVTVLCFIIVQNVAGIDVYILKICEFGLKMLPEIFGQF